MLYLIYWNKIDSRMWDKPIYWHKNPEQVWSWKYDFAHASLNLLAKKPSFVVQGKWKFW